MASTIASYPSDESIGIASRIGIFMSSHCLIRLIKCCFEERLG